MIDEPSVANPSEILSLSSLPTSIDSTHPSNPFLPKPTSRTTRYGEGHEASAVKRELNGFNFELCPAWTAITYYFGRGIRLRELKGIVSSITYHLSHQSGMKLPPLSRNTKRSLGLLVKYINNHYTIFVPVFRFVKLCDENKQPIPFLDAGITNEESGNTSTQHEL
jgi:hypothetical protein